MNASKQLQSGQGARSRHVALFLCCMAEYMPLALLSVTLPVLLRRQGASLEQLGLLSLVFIPWALKFAWAPLIDRRPLWGQGRYRSWLLTGLPVAALMVWSLGQRSLEQWISWPWGLALVLIALTCVCATLDTASHGLGVLLLTPQERGAGNGVQQAGMMAGNLVGGAGAVMGLEWLGWSSVCAALAAMYALPWLALWGLREPSSAPSASRGLKLLWSAASTPGMGRWLAWLFAFGAVYGCFGVPYQAALVDAGMSMVEIGLVQGALISVMGMMGGALGGLWVQRRGRRGGFLVAGAVFAVALAPSLWAFAGGAPTRAALYVGMGSAYLGAMSVTTVLYTLMMDRARASEASTDYTVQYSALQLAGFMGWGLGAWLAAQVGHVTLFAGAILGVVALWGMSSWAGALPAGATTPSEPQEVTR